MLQEKETVLEYLARNKVDLRDLYSLLNGPRLGDFHFTDGSYFPLPVENKTIDGVFITPNCYFAGYVIDEPVSKIRAKTYCWFNGCKLPSTDVIYHLVRKNREKIEASLKKIVSYFLDDHSWYLPEGRFWTEDTSFSDADACVLGVRYCSPVLPGDPLPLLVSQLEKEREKPYDIRDPKCVLWGFPEEMHLGFKEYLQKEKSRPSVGEYLLKNGHRSGTPVYDQEAGIFFNANMYIRLEGMQKEELSQAEVKTLMKAENLHLPTYFELRQLQKVFEVVNEKLKAVGMQDKQLPQDVVGSFWYDGLSANSNTRRRLVVVEKKNKVPDIYLAWQDMMENWGSF